MDTLKFKKGDSQRNIEISDNGKCASWIYQISDGELASCKPLERGETISFLMSGHGRLEMGFYQPDDKKLNIGNYNTIPNLMTCCADVKCQVEKKVISVRLENKIETTYANKTESKDYDQSKHVFICFNLKYGPIGLCGKYLYVSSFPLPSFIFF